MLLHELLMAKQLIGLIKIPSVFLCLWSRKIILKDDLPLAFSSLFENFWLTWKQQSGHLIAKIENTNTTT